MEGESKAEDDVAFAQRLLAGWDGLGPQLARYIGVQTVGDAVAMLLMGDDNHRRKLLAARHGPEVSGRRA